MTGNLAGTIGLHVVRPIRNSHNPRCVLVFVLSGVALMVDSASQKGFSDNFLVSPFLAE